MIIKLSEKSDRKTAQIVESDLKNNYNHQFTLTLYYTAKNYYTYDIKCERCKCFYAIFIARGKYKFEDYMNFTHVVNLYGIQYAYDNEILTCDEYIIKSIIE